MHSCRVQVVTEGFVEDRTLREREMGGRQRKGNRARLIQLSEDSIRWGARAGRPLSELA